MSDTLLGFDQSKWQSGVYAGGGGFSFAFTKAGEGNSYRDPTYSAAIAAIRAHGLIPGAYHFARPDLGNSPESEADWFLSVVGDPAGMLLALDAESAGGDQAWCQAFSDHLGARLGGHQPAFYSYHAWMVERGIGVARSWLWLAWPSVNGDLPSMPPWGRPAMQQYGVGPVPGLTGDVDRNRFFGSIDELRALTVGGGTQEKRMDRDDWAAIYRALFTLLLRIPGAVAGDVAQRYESQLFADAALEPGQADVAMASFLSDVLAQRPDLSVPLLPVVKLVAVGPGAAVSEAQVRSWAADEVAKRIGNG